ncbi:unnamed protein product [Meganyctiphanes norvegica]|uniref:Hexosyltransferase n=1 Tax=Meganyctiphanes norvegica TaxID=48144 RepID=A0AAV2RBI5_MEGNR
MEDIRISTEHEDKNHNKYYTRNIFRKCIYLTGKWNLKIYVAILALVCLPYILSLIEDIIEAMSVGLWGYQLNLKGGNGSYCSGREPFIPSAREEFPHGTAPDVPINFPVDEPNFCSDNPGLEVIAYVASTIAAIDRRNITRHTWGSAYKQGLRMRVVFMVGRPVDVMEEKILHTESEVYHDMIQGDYTEDYHLVTYKILSSLHWVSSRCPSVPWVIRADDDILVDPFLLHKLLPRVEEDGINCYLWPKSHVKRTGKWAVTKQEWSYKYYPPYCAGAFVLHHHQLLSRILEASCSIPMMVWMEDTYVFGFLAGEAGGIRPELKVLQHSHVDDMILVDDLGKVTSWAEINDRTSWWENIVKFHKGSSEHSGKERTFNIYYIFLILELFLIHIWYCNLY